jgi:hypothetical protein
MSQLKGRFSQPGNWKELTSFFVGLKPGGIKCMADRSRMNQEIHVRICGSVGGGSPAPPDSESNVLWKFSSW